MNTVKNYFRTNQMAVRFLKAYPTRDDYKDVGSNVVYINVWNWDPEWTISVSDGVKELPVEQIYGLDPLHTASYEVARVSDGGSSRPPSPHSRAFISFRSRPPTPTRR